MAISNKEELFRGKQGRDELIAQLSDVNGKEVVSVRLWYYDENDTLMPGRNGLNITLENFQKLFAAPAVKRLLAAKATTKKV